ncbi:DeoR family transcriptional regulator [Marinomonas sp. TI.3.20]|uniref:DeoR family transcriptional regulator n=1 Tax=Marinomonas sp. TI.3.20 TaxID=3121296 RepID=UPI00311D8248
MNRVDENTQRQQKILLLLALDDSLTTSMLGQRFMLPNKVIQKDLIALEQLGLLTQTQENLTLVTSE